MRDWNTRPISLLLSYRLCNLELHASTLDRHSRGCHERTEITRPGACGVATAALDLHRAGRRRPDHLAGRPATVGRLAWFEVCAGWLRRAVPGRIRIAKGDHQHASARDAADLRRAG